MTDMRYNARDLMELEEKAEKYDSIRHWIKVGVAVLFAIVLFFIAVGLVLKLVNPRLNLYKSNTEKQAVIKEQEAISEAAVFAAQKRITQATAEATARDIEAQAIANAQQKIASTLTPEYLMWRYLEVLATTENQIIYVPTEGGIPILEASRSLQAATTVPADGG